MKNCGTPRWPVRSTISKAAVSSSVTSTSSYSMPFAPSSALALAQYGHHSIEYICTRAIATSARSLFAKPLRHGYSRIQTQYEHAASENCYRGAGRGTA